MKRKIKKKTKITKKPRKKNSHKDPKTGLYKFSPLESFKGGYDLAFTTDIDKFEGFLLGYGYTAAGWLYAKSMINPSRKDIKNLTDYDVKKGVILLKNHVKKLDRDMNTNIYEKEMNKALKKDA